MDGAELAPKLENLAQVASVDTSALGALLDGVSVKVACDVTNPLNGPEGATAVFGPQKGVQPEQVEFFDSLHLHFATASGHGDDALLPGSGAAGGLGFALRAFLHAELTPGINLVADAVGLADAVQGADWVFTGEGSVDSQTINGKTPAGVTAIARSAGLRYVYTGNVHDEAGQSTYCASCGERTIGRDWYTITDWQLDRNACCVSCGAPCPGLFEPLPGNWGARRAPILIAAA